MMRARSFSRAFFRAVFNARKRTVAEAEAELQRVIAVWVVLFSCFLVACGGICAQSFDVVCCALPPSLQRSPPHPGSVEALSPGSQAGVLIALHCRTSLSLLPTVYITIVTIYMTMVVLTLPLHPQPSRAPCRRRRLLVGCSASAVKQLRIITRPQVRYTTKTMRNTRNCNPNQNKMMKETRRARDAADDGGG